MRRRVILESPYAGDRETNDRYLAACLRDSLERGEAPFASHAIYTRALDDGVAEQRALGIDAGFAWREMAEATVVYADLGISGGMRAGVEHALKLGHPIAYRSLGGAWRELALERSKR